MNRIEQRFSALKASNRAALICYFMPGASGQLDALSVLNLMASSGVDVIELGLPFSDPMADGSTIQKAAETALKNGISVKSVLQTVADFRAENNTTPLVLMGYLNPIETYGFERFAQDAKSAGVDGLIVVDLPMESSQQESAAVRAAGIHPIQLVAPTTTDKRQQEICQHSSGFLYYVALKGTTGAATLDVDAVSKRLKFLKKQSTVPIAVGFGIKNKETAAEIARVADAVVVGSSVVEILAQDDTAEKLSHQLTQFLDQLSSAMQRE